MKRFLENMIKDNPGFSEYLDEALQKDKIVVTRIVAVASLILYSFFTVVDYYSIKEHLIEIFTIRLVVDLYLVFTFLITFKNDFFLRHYGIITASYYILIGLGIELMLLFVDQNDLAFYTYFAGLMVVIFAGYTWTYLNSTVTLAITLFFILLYVGIYYFSYQGEDGFIVSMLINHVAFLITAIVIGLLADILLKQYLYRQYMMQSRLRELLLTKDKLPFVREQQEDFLESLPNLHQYKVQLTKQISDADYCNLLLSVNCLQLVEEDWITQKSNRFKSIDWDNSIIASLDEILPDSKIIAFSGKNKLYFSYLLKNRDKEEIENKINLIMTLVEQNIKKIYAVKKISPCIGSVNIFQEKTAPEALIDICNKNLLAQLDQKRDEYKRLKGMTRDNKVASLEEFVKKPVKSDFGQT